MRIIIVAVVVMTATPAVVKQACADAFPVTAGIVQDDVLFDSSTVLLIARGLDFGGFVQSGPQPCLTAGCAVGDTIDLSGTYLSLGGGGVFGEVIVGGISVPFADATMAFLVGPVSVAPLASAPFRMTGHIRGLDEHGLVLAETNVFGRGTATVAMDAGAPSELFLRNLFFEFSGAAPVPEPASLLLVGSVVIPALVRRRQRRGACGR